MEVEFIRSKSKLEIDKEPEFQPVLPLSLFLKHQYEVVIIHEA